MDKDKLAKIMEAVADGKLSPEAACHQLESLPYKDLEFAKIDLHRSIRQGIPEVIFCPGKTPEQIVKIAQELKQHHITVLATRADALQAEAILPLLPGAIYDNNSRVIIWGELSQQLPQSLPQPLNKPPQVAIVTAGTADLPVAEEAAVILTASGVQVKRLYDVGVAGIHRLFANLDVFQDVSATIVVAGMDGALPSVIGGLIACPVIAVPTSIGYGSSFQGLAALLTMLNSCASGLVVVNIDNGFGAAIAAMRILSQIKVNKETDCLTQKA